MALLDGMKKKELGYMLAVLAAACVLAWFLVYAPAIRELKRLKAEVAARQEAMAGTMRQWDEMRRSKGVETPRWEASVRRWEERLPSEPMADALMAELGELAVRHRLANFRLSVPTEGGGSTNAMGAALAGVSAPKDNVARPAELNYEIAFRSSYRDLSAFLDELPHLRRLVALRTLQVRDNEGDMETKLSISAYYRKRP